MIAMVRQVIHAKSTKKEYRKFFGVLIFMAIAATLMSTLITFSVTDWIRWYVGGSMLVFGGFKLISLDSYSEVIPQYDPLAARYSWYSFVFPIIEVALGMFYILDVLPSVRYIITFIIFGFSLYGMYTNLQRRGPSRDNTWLGNIFLIPMSTAILAEDFIVTVFSLALVILSIFH